MSLYPPGGNYYEEVQVEFINEMLDRGLPMAAMVEQLAELQPPVKRRPCDVRKTCERRIAAVKADRWNWSTNLDPIGMELAYMGSPHEWANLNYYERREVVLRLQRLMDTGRPHPAFPQVDIMATSGPSGLSLWCESVGMVDSHYITNPFGRRARVAAEAKANAGVNA